MQKQQTFGRNMGYSAALLLAVLTLLFYHLSTPVFSGIRFQAAGHQDQEGTLPLRFPEQQEPTTYLVSLQLHLAPLHTTLFRVIGDDCVDTLQINGRKVDGPRFCNFDTGDAVDLSSYLQAGNNTVIAYVSNQNGIGAFNLKPASTDTMSLLFLASLLATLGVGGFLLLSPWKYFEDRTLFSLFFGASALRLVYALLTPFTLRAYDADGHLDYIRYILEHWSIPSPLGGWQFYHPPLYYALAAVWALPVRLLGLPNTTLTLHLQMFSVLLSVCTVGALVWIAHLLFPQEKDRSIRLLFFTTLAFFPGLVQFASRINNDALLVLLLFLSFGWLLKFWKSGNKREWYASLFLCIGAILTKNNGLVLLAVIFATLFFQQKLSKKVRMKIGVSSLLLASCIVGVFSIARMPSTPTSADTLIVGNIKALDGSLKLRTNLQTFATFNPAALIAYPFNDTRNDVYRRQYFWEFFFRSAFFGEFRYPESMLTLGRVIVGTGIFLIPLLVLGFIGALRKKHEALPLLLCFAMVLLAHIAERVMSPYSSIQDFRYSILALLPLGYLALQGLQALPNKFRPGGMLLLQFLPLLSATFLLTLLFL